MQTADQKTSSCQSDRPGGLHWLDRMVRLRFADERAVWVVDEILAHGVVLSRLDTNIVGPHKHFESWEQLENGKAQAV
jgi:hypothetical protein